MHNLYRLLRISRDIPVHDLAKAAGVTNSYICAIEKGDRTPSPRVESDILNALQVTPEQFSYMKQKNANIGKFEQALLMVLQVLCGRKVTISTEPDASQLDHEAHFNVIYHEKSYDFSEDQLLAAYQFQEHRLLLDKAERYLRLFALDNMNAKPDDANVAGALRYFMQQYSMSFEKAMELREEFVQRYQEDYDPQIPEKTLWISAIHGVLIEHFTIS